MSSLPQCNKSFPVVSIIHINYYWPVTKMSTRKLKRRTFSRFRSRALIFLADFVLNKERHLFDVFKAKLINEWGYIESLD